MLCERSVAARSFSQNVLRKATRVQRTCGQIAKSESLGSSLTSHQTASGLSAENHKAPASVSQTGTSVGNYQDLGRNLLVG